MREAFSQGLCELGYVEGTSIVVEYRGAAGKIERLPDVAGELFRLNVDVIVAPNTPAARAVQQVTTSVPIVVPVMGDPVGHGLVVGLGHPGGNITGLTFLGPELLPKRLALALLKEALPAVSRVAALWHPAAYGEPTMEEHDEGDRGRRAVPVKPRRGSFSLSILTCWTAPTKGDITDKSKECARGPG